MHCFRFAKYVISLCFKFDYEMSLKKKLHVKHKGFQIENYEGFLLRKIRVSNILYSIRVHYSWKKKNKKLINNSNLICLRSKIK